MIRARLIMLAVVGGLALTAIGAQTASGATLSPSAGFKMSSVSIVGDDVYWFQRSPSNRTRYRTLRPPPSTTSPGMAIPLVYADTPGRILHRKLGTTKVSVAYKPPKGMQITGFAARAGRIAVGLRGFARTPDSSIVELTATASGWTAKTLVERAGGERDGRCGASVTLLNIDADRDLIYEDSTIEGRDGKCELSRRQSTYRQVDLAGVTTDLSSSRGGWSLNPNDQADLRYRASSGSWFARSGRNGTLLGLFNIETGATADTRMMYSSDGRIEVTAGGNILRQAFDENERRFFTLNRTPENLNENFYFKRSKYTTWFHLCGDKVLEIARKRGKRARRGKRGTSGGRYWNLYLRSQDGTVKSKLPGKLPRATTFNGCNADTALFSKTGRKGRVRQTSVSLAG